MCRLLQLVAIVLIAASAHAQTVTPHDDQIVTIRADGTPIGTLLAELAERYPLEKVTIQAEVRQHPVWIVLDDVPLRTALRRILEASGLDFAISGRRVVVGDWTETAGLKAGRYRPSQSSASNADHDVRSGRHLGRPADADSQSQGDHQEAARRAAEAAEQQQAISDAAGDESMIMPAIPVRFVANGENITYLEPNFVPYKMRPEVRARRMAIDVATIP